MAEPPFDVAKVHRWFAIECNNAAWDQVEAEQRAPEDTERMLHTAHASLYHWREVGGALNELRALYLLATAYASAGLGEAAQRHAELALAKLTPLGDEATLWDRACTHGSAARAYLAAGYADAARTQHAQASRHAEGFEHPDESEVFAKLFPAPG